MPVQNKIDENGHYLRWGNSGKKYYYNPQNISSKKRARSKVLNQMKAIFANQGKVKR